MNVQQLLVLLFLIELTGGQVTCPSSCYCDESWVYINCVGDGLWQVPPDIPLTVTRLELRNYAMGNLGASHLSGLSNLTELKVQQTQIERVDDATFAHLSRLVRLDLSQNRLENITKDTFSGLVNLRYLDLSSNQLVHVSGAFQDMENIEQLNLRDNHLKHLTGETFTGLQRVQYLNLDSNDIATMDIGTFQSLTHLVHLILSNNPLANLTRLDFFSARLLYIDVSHVGLLRVPQSLTQMVRDLRLAKNNLTQIRRGDFDSYPHLGLLVLDDNQITEIENDALGRQESLLRLWLNGNLLRKVPLNLPPTLRTLYIEENQLETLPAFAFQGLTNVEQLFLQRNKIKELSVCAFCDLLSLRGLDLQSNLIESIQEGVFANMSHLESLDLSQNPLQVLQPSCFAGADSLHVLRLSRIKTLPRFDGGAFDVLKQLEVLELYDSAAFSQLLLNSTRVLHALRNVRELNIMHNNIDKLRPDFAHFFPNLREIKLSGNNWNCDSDVLWMAQWIKKAEVQFYRSYSIRCTQPLHLQNRPVMTLTEADFPTTVVLSTTTTTTTTTVASTPRTTVTTTQPTTTTAATTTTKPVLTTPSTTTTTAPSTTPVTTTPVLLTTTIKSTTEPTTTTDSTTIELTTTTTITTTTQQSTTKTPTTTHPTTTTTTLTTTPTTMKPKAKPRAPAVTVDDPEDEDNQQFLIVAMSLVSGVLLVILGSAAALLVYRCHHGGSSNGSGSCPVVKRNGSISYSPQRDEVSFVTVTEGTVGLKTANHHGLGNKLYYVMGENGKDSLAEADIHELLSPPEDDGFYPYSAT